MSEHPFLLFAAAISWRLTFASALLAGLWFLWRRWSLRSWRRSFDAGLKARHLSAGDPTASVYDPRPFRRPRD